MGWLGRIFGRADSGRAGAEDDPDAIMREAYAAHRAGDTVRAARLYEDILARRPDDSDALYLLGEIACEDGRYQNAIDLLRKASALNPGESAFHEKLAHALQASGRAAEAIASYRSTLALDPQNAEAANNLGCLLSEQGDVAGARESFEAAVLARPDLVQARFNLANLLRESGMPTEAIEHFRVAAAAEPQHAKVGNNLGCALQSLGRVAEAAEGYRRAIEADPDYGIGYKNLGNALRELGQFEPARLNYERALELLPGDAEASHYLDALRHANPARAPAEYVARMFDAFAGKFDDTLVNKMGYRTPQLLLEALQSASPPAAMSVLDMGCGTGLFGERVRGLSRHITGVDLSPEMIEKARQRGCYEELLVRDLLDYLAEARSESFDLAAAVDVFVYLGDLSAVFQRTRGLLRPQGLFAYSVEANLQSETDFELMPTGRYCHSRSYIARLARESGFTEVACSLTALREEKGLPVQGYVCVLKRSVLRSEISV